MGLETQQQQTTTELVTAPTAPETAHHMAIAPDPAGEAEAASQQPDDTLEIVVEKRLLLEHDDGEGGSGGGRWMTIFRVPAHVRAANKGLYKPRLVSIGPYYRGRRALRVMEQHKWRCLHDLLAMYPQASLSGCVGAVRGVERQTRRRYSQRTGIFDAAESDEFAQMLLLDGCFVLVFLIRFQLGEPDRLCDVGWGLPQLLSDLLLLENQIPFSVLLALFRALSPDANRLSLLTLILRTYNLQDSPFPQRLVPATTPPTHQDEDEGEGEEIHHLLHAFYEAFVARADDPQASAEPPPRCVAWLRRMGLRFKTAVSKRLAFVRDDMPRVPAWMTLSSCFSNFTDLIGVTTPTEPDGRTEPAPAPPMVVPSVTLLREAGVRFETAPAAPPRHRHTLDITFDKARGVLRMPRMRVDYASKARLVNLVAFEQTRGTLPQRGAAATPVSSYAALLGNLARTGADVAHLQKRGIVDNLLNDHDDAAKRFFQPLGDCASLDYGGGHLFADVFRDLNGYYNSSCRRHRAKFMRDHCSSPWAVLALVVAVCAFAFALFKFSTTIYGIAHPYDCPRC